MGHPVVVTLALELLEDFRNAGHAFEGDGAVDFSAEGEAHAFAVLRARGAPVAHGYGDFGGVDAAFEVSGINVGC
jgi:hypothetical protein